MAEQQNDHQAKRARHEVSADVDTLHTILTVERHEDAASLTTRLEECWEELFGTQYDVIAFLYSVVLTKLSLVAPPSPREAAVSAFTALDSDQSGFIPSTRFGMVKSPCGIQQ